MQPDQAYAWLLLAERRQRILMSLKQPLTATQLSRLTDMTLKSCMSVLAELVIYGLARCLNTRSRRSRVYWLSELGALCQQELCSENNLPPRKHDLPEVDWELYGWVCYSHRSTIIKTLTRPMQPATIKRRALFENPELRMSANNVRDVIRLFLARGIVRRVRIKHKAHVHYELTGKGKTLKALLLGAENSSYIYMNLIEE